jgi:envelope integrity protein B
VKGLLILGHTIASRAAFLVSTLIIVAPAALARAQDGPIAPIALIPHRAIYELSLDQTRGDSQISGVRGRIVYDFDGNACDGYSLEFRQLSQLQSGEGKVSTSDLHSTTWEGGDAKKFKFTSQNFVDENLVNTVDGQAERGATATAVDLTKPEPKALSLDPAVVFPTEHMVRAIAAGLSGKNVLSFPVFDGSETGDKVFNTLTVVGHKIAPNTHKHDDAAANEPKLANVARWPVTISYFGSDKAAEGGEITPDYAIGFELYQNGISRALSLDYNDFVVTGKLTSLEFKRIKPCH